MWSWSRPRVSVALGRERKDPFELKVKNSWCAQDVLSAAAAHYGLESIDRYSLFVHFDVACPPERLGGEEEMGEVLSRPGMDKAVFLVLQDALDEFVIVPRDDANGPQSPQSSGLYPTFTAAGDTQVSSSFHPYGSVSFSPPHSVSSYLMDNRVSGGGVSQRQKVVTYSHSSYEALRLSRFDLGVHAPSITDKKNDFSLPLAELSVTLMSQKLAAWNLDMEKAIIHAINEQEQQLSIDREARLLRLQEAEEEAEELRRARVERAERERKEREEREERERKEREELERRERERLQREEKERLAREERERREAEDRERARREMERRLELERLDRERQRLERERIEEEQRRERERERLEEERKAELERRERERRLELERRERERRLELERREREQREREEQLRLEQQRKEIDLVDQLASLEVAKQQQKQQKSSLHGSGGSDGGTAPVAGVQQGPLIPELAMPASFVPPYPGQAQRQTTDSQRSGDMPQTHQQHHNNAQPFGYVGQAQHPICGGPISPVVASHSPSGSPMPPTHSYPAAQPNSVPQIPTVTQLQSSAAPTPQSLSPQHIPTQTSPPASQSAVSDALREQIAWYVQQGVPQSAAIAAIQKYGQDHAKVADYVTSCQALSLKGFPLPRVIQSLNIGHPNQHLVMQLLQAIQRTHPDSFVINALRLMNNDVTAANVFLEGVCTLIEMGYDYVRSANAMLAHGNDVNAAVTALLDS